jgi:hypothetical protein
MCRSRRGSHRYRAVRRPAINANDHPMVVPLPAFTPAGYSANLACGAVNQFTRALQPIHHCFLSRIPACLRSPSHPARERVESSSAAEGATGPRKRSGKRTAAGTGISGKPAGVPNACRTDEVRGAPKCLESFRYRDRGGSATPARIAGA